MKSNVLALIFFLCLSSFSARVSGQSGCGHDSTVVTWVYGYNQWLFERTYAVTTATYDLDSGIVVTCTELGYPPAPANCNTGYWSRTDTTFDGAGRPLAWLTYTGSPGGWVNDRRVVRTYDPTYGVLVFEATLQWNGASWDSTEVTTRVLNGTGQVIETAHYDFSGASRQARARELVTYIDGHPNDRTYQHGDLGNWVNDSLYQFSYSGTIRTGLAISLWDTGTSNWAFLSLVPYLNQTGEWCAERKRYDDNVVSGIQTLDSVTWYVDTLERVVYYHSFAWADFDLGGTFFPTAYIKDFDSGYLRGELLLTHTSEGDYALEVIAGDSTWFPVDRPYVTDYTYDTLNHVTQIVNTGGCTNPCGSEFTYIIEPDGFQASEHYYRWNMTGQEDVYTIAERSPANQPMLVAPAWEYDVPLCYRAQYQPHITLAGGCAPYTVSWTPATGLSSDTVLNPVITVTGYQAYTIVVTDANGATDTLSYSLTPAIDMQLNGPATVCDTLRTLELVNGLGLTNQWYRDGLPIAGATDHIYRADSAGSYYVVNTIQQPSQHFDEQTCTNYSDTVLVIPHAPLTADAGGDRTLCAGDTLTLGGQPTGSGGIGSLHYIWTPSFDLESDTLANPLAFPSATTFYTVQVIDSAGCQAGALAEIAVSPGFMPVLSHSGDTLYATAGAASYTWYRNDTLVSSGTDPFILPLLNGIYTVVATDSLGCSAESAEYNYLFTGLSSVASSSDVRVFPNPANEAIRIVSGTRTGGMVITVVDMTGRVCLQETFTSADAVLNVRDLLPGLFQLRVVSDAGPRVMPLLIHR